MLFGSCLSRFGITYSTFYKCVFARIVFEIAATTPQAFESATMDSFPDDRLRLIFTCCHPAINQEAQVALTLRTLGGLSTPEIAKAFLLPEA